MELVSRDESTWKVSVITIDWRKSYL